MKYTVDRKSGSGTGKRPKGKNSPESRKKVLALALWGLAALTLYLVFSKHFAVTTVQVMEVLVLGSLLLYGAVLITVSGLRKEPEGGKAGDKAERKEKEEKLARLEKLSKGLIIFVIPLLFLLIFDFLLSTWQMFGSGVLGFGKPKR